MRFEEFGDPGELGPRASDAFEAAGRFDHVAEMTAGVQDVPVFQRFA